MKDYIVGILTLIEYELKLIKVSSTNEVEAIKQVLVDLCGTEELKESQRKWNSNLGETLEEVCGNCYHSDIIVNVIEP